MKLFLPIRNGVTQGFVFDRNGRDFSERDRSVVDLLKPHLLQLEEGARLRRLVAALAGGDKSLRGSAEALSGREQEILALVAEGKSNGEIAAALSIAQGTVRKHLENIYAKLGVHTRTAAVAHVWPAHRYGRRIRPSARWRCAIGPARCA